jgi:POT family proton-dependent oligopeptide transporter
VLFRSTYLGGSRYLPRDNRPSKSAGDPESKAAQHAPITTYLLLLAVIMIVVVFRAAYEQSGNTLALWADTGVDRNAGHWFAIPMTWFQSLNPLMIFLFTPIIVAYWTSVAKRGREPGSISKMAIGAIIVGVSYFLLAAVAHVSGESRASWIWVVVFFLVYTVGELFILPVGLGLFGKLAPAEFAATAIAAWFVAAFFGNLAAGFVGALWSVVSVPTFFAMVGLIGIASGLLLSALSPWGNRIEADAAQSNRGADESVDASALAADSRL